MAEPAEQGTGAAHPALPLRGRLLAELVGRPGTTELRCAGREQDRVLLAAHNCHTYVAVWVRPFGPRGRALLAAMQPGEAFPAGDIGLLLALGTREGIDRDAGGRWRGLAIRPEQIYTPEEVLARHTQVWQGLATPDPAGPALGLHPAKVAQIEGFVEAAGLTSAIPSVWVGKRIAGADELWSVLWVWPTALAAVACTRWDRVPSGLRPDRWLAAALEAAAEEEKR